ncbi:hypothetical protein GCM10007079_45370 [Nocardiopsis terrae]|uniref:Short C-terminal domain-containing protein n=1 Tax=Nocardiopsis terrae TaxID=372655 RepID=A0ABR9HKY9_9ACTN|nr:DUF4429 domain-containing protein [Nocardiopsis terrae]MBE1459653.1 hypothetical protein [Nocardiopsis terrae]GHC94667.1 hypothetical protein GCM10007079_45370 [Nocardiopsis terrae]
MEELRGHHAIWRFDEERVRIGFGTGRKVPHLCRALGQCSVPLAAVREVDFDPGDRKQGWRLRVRLVDGADPYAGLETVGTAAPATPLVLTGPHDRELVAEYCADRLTESARYAREVRGAPLDLSEVAMGLVVRPPFQARTGEGSVSFDGERVRLHWDGWMASTAKGQEKSREFPLSEIESLQWSPQVDFGEGFLRVVLRGATIPEASGLEHDFFTLVSHGPKGSDETLLMAATVNSHIALAKQEPGEEAGEEPAALAAGAADGSDEIFAKIRELGNLHAEGLLTDEEFGTKKAELLGRL